MGLPAVVRKSLVCFCHAVRVFLLLNCRTTVVIGIEKFGRKALHHRFFRTFARITDEPSEGEGGTAVGTDFHRNLIGGTTHGGS